MTKTLGRILAFALSALLVIGSFSVAIAESSTSDKFYIYAFNTDLEKQLTLLYERYPELKDKIVYVNAGSSDTFQEKIDALLKTPDAEDYPDIFCLEGGFIMKYANSDYTMDVSKVGITADDMVSRFGSEKFREQSAKLLCTFLLTLRGTPFLFQGEELGMTNAHMDRISEYQDVDTLNHYRDVMQTGEQNEAELMAVIVDRSRDNARTPMQWNAGFNAGFTTGTPWIGVNPNHTQINAEAEERDTTSILAYYRRMIHLRKQEPVLIYGDYQPLCIEHTQVYAYLREWETQRILVLLNFSANATKICLPDTVQAGSATALLIGNGDVSTLEQNQPLTSYEAQVWRLS